jgi:hypothetical protein
VSQDLPPADKTLKQISPESLIDIQRKQILISCRMCGFQTELAPSTLWMWFSRICWTLFAIC